MALLETRNAAMHFGGLKAVDDVSMSVQAGEIYGIIGPNGAGKTTFFNVCSGCYTPTSGRVLFDGHDITRMHPDQIVRLGMARTFQNIKLFHNMSVLDNVKIGFHIHTTANLFDAILHSPKYRRDEALVEAEGRRLLERVGLDEYAGVKAGNLSYGIQRKVEIARALAAGPKILLLDEPAAGMNPNETQALLEFVRRLNGEGVTIAVIEHDMKFVMNLCHKIMVLNYGQKLCEGTAMEVKNNPEVVEAYFGKSVQMNLN